MAMVLETRRMRLVPVTRGDEDWLCALLWKADVRRHLCDDVVLPRETVRAAIDDSVDAGSVTSYWRLDAVGDGVGFVGLRAPATATLALRAIGWRSLEVVIALDPGFWGRGFAQEALAAVAGYAGRDGVTFALVGCIDEANGRSHSLMKRCGFHELGRIGGRQPMVVYERAV